MFMDTWTDVDQQHVPWRNSYTCTHTSCFLALSFAAKKGLSPLKLVTSLHKQRSETHDKRHTFRYQHNLQGKRKHNNNDVTQRNSTQTQLNTIMPRFFDDYSNTYLTHDSAAGRKQQRRGWKFRENFKLHYEAHLQEWQSGPMGLASAQQAFIKRSGNAPPPLPEGWVEENDEATHISYYVHAETGRRTWVRPSFRPPPMGGAPMSGASTSTSGGFNRGPPPPNNFNQGPPPQQYSRPPPTYNQPPPAFNQPPPAFHPGQPPPFQQFSGPPPPAQFNGPPPPPLQQFPPPQR
jgi:U1 small nuclear ribonucleoprotein C